MSVSELVDSLLWEGYALYPYTPAATKNSTPTPFGIVYPASYADGRSTFNHMQVDVALAEPGPVTAEVRFLQSAGPRHEGEARSFEAPEGERWLEFPPLSIRTELTIDGARATLRIENHTQVADGIDRGEALQHSLISTHPILRVAGGKFVSPLESRLRSVNSYPVLASAEDDVIVGAAIILPDHPQLAPESLGGLFDSTEIEEALLLHVQVLSDEERSAIAGGDSAVREMIERAEAATPEDILALHGRVTLRPPEPSAAVRDPTRGEQRVEADGTIFTRGMKVRLRPPPDADLQARMLDGRTATVERIYVEYDGKVHLGVIVDDMPGQDLMRETGRFLFFFAPEVEVLG